MQFLVSTSRTAAVDAATFAEHLPQEVARVRELYGESFIRQIWHRADRPGALILAEAVDSDDAERLLRTLPLVGLGAVAVDGIVPLRPYAGFAEA